jgi:hypothetical protein
MDQPKTVPAALWPQEEGQRNGGTIGQSRSGTHESAEKAPLGIEERTGFAA